MDNFTKIENSSNLATYHYDKLSGNLFIEFKNGSVYMYIAVPKEVFAEFEKAPSKGSFLAREIKGKYECQNWTVKPEEKPEENSEKIVENKP